jgi:hypothetical protein
MTMGVQILVMAEKPLTACGSKKFQLDTMGDHLCTCSAHSGAKKAHDRAKKAHDWVVDQQADLFHTIHTVKTQHVTKSKSRYCGDIELSVYLAIETGLVPLVLDLLFLNESADPN